MNNLYIYGGTEKEKINSKNNDYIYYINTGIVIGDGKKINDLKRIHQIAIERRDEYISYINSLNKNFLALDEFINQDELIDLMEQNNFQNCNYRNLSGGIVAIHSGWKI